MYNIYTNIIAYCILYCRSGNFLLIIHCVECEIFQIVEGFNSGDLYTSLLYSWLSHLPKQLVICSRRSFLLWTRTNHHNKDVLQPSKGMKQPVGSYTWVAFTKLIICCKMYFMCSYFAVVFNREIQIFLIYSKYNFLI